MKVQIVQKGHLTFLRRYLLGFIPLYWYEGYDGGWEFSRTPIEMDKAINIVKRWNEQAKEQDMLDVSEEKIVFEANI